MKRQDLFFHLGCAFDFLADRMGEEQTELFLERNWDDPIPDAWRLCLQSEEVMLSESSVLYRMLYYAGLKNRHEMETMVLRLFYLYRHTQRLP